MNARVFHVQAHAFLALCGVAQACVSLSLCRPNNACLCTLTNFANVVEHAFEQHALVSNVAVDGELCAL